MKKILVLGSGALKIGEEGEFDYSGSQALKALKEEGITTVLINPNIATIQTSKELADKIYYLPVTPYFVEKVIKKEKVEGIFLSFGGQTALNCGLALERLGVFKKYGVKVLGSTVKSIEVTEDRELFAKELAKIDVKVPKGGFARTLDQALKIAEQLGVTDKQVFVWCKKFKDSGVKGLKVRKPTGQPPVRGNKARKIKALRPKA